LLVFGFFAIMAVIRLGNKLIGVTEDPMLGKLSPMVPIFIPMAFTGELVYRLSYFARGIGDFLPTVGRQAGTGALERLAFAIPDFPVQILSAFFMLNGALAGCYIFWRFCLEDFEGIVKFKNFVAVNLVIGIMLVLYLTAIF